MARGDAVICNSQYTARLVRERHPAAAARVGVIYRGVDLEKFDPASVPPDRVRDLREQWGIAPGKRIVLLPARLTRWKGQQVLIDAAAQLQEQGEYGDVVFVLAGDDQGRSAYRAELEASIEDHGLLGRVVIAGHCEDMLAAYKASHLTVLPSIEAEAFGRSSIESQAMGCPVIASNIGAFPETIAPEPGLLASVVNGGGSEPEGPPPSAAPKSLAVRAGQSSGPLQFAAMRFSNGQQRARIVAEAGNGACPPRLLKMVVAASNLDGL